MSLSGNYSHPMSVEIAHVIVSRQHSNGNITMCVYLVDLLSQGVTDTASFFNEPQFNFDKMLKSFIEDGEVEFKKADYALAHNIVYAGVNYARDLGFMPHKEFTATTRFMLEADTDEVELIDIECGLNGKPAYMQSIDDTPVQAQTIIKKFEKAVGPGNFIIVGHDLFEDDNDFGDDFFGDEDLEDDFEDEEGDDSVDIYQDKTLEEKKAIFKTMDSKVKDISLAAMPDMVVLLQSISGDLLRKEDIERFYDDFMEQLGTFEILSPEDIPEGLWGMDANAILNREKLAVLFGEISELMFEEPDDCRKKLRRYEREFKDVPLFRMLQLWTLKHMGNKKYASKLKQYCKKFPDYQILNLMRHSHEIPEKSLKDQEKLKLPLVSFFPNRDAIHPLEFYAWLDYQLLNLIAEKNISRVAAFNGFVFTYEDILTKNQYKRLYNMSLLLKFLNVIQQLREENTQDDRIG